MKISHFAWLILFLGVWAFRQTGNADTSELHKISGSAIVTDGDTIKINDVRIRLLGIDACERGQKALQEGIEVDCYQTSKEYLEGLVDGNTVECGYEDEDRYQRPLAICRVDDLDINSEMIRAGQAVIYRYRGRATYPELEVIESRAKADKIGLWATQFISPSEYRKLRRKR